MKRLLITLIFVVSFLGVVLGASASGAIKSKHKGKAGLDGQSIGCGYCHGTEKGHVPKKKDLDLDLLRKSKYCSMDGCHAG